MTYSPIYTTANMVYAKTGLTSTEVNLSDDNVLAAIIQDAEVEVETITGRKFTSGNSATEYISCNDKDILDKYQTKITLRYFPIQSITEFKTVDSSDTAVSTFGTLTSVQIAAGTITTTDYWLEVQEDATDNTIRPNGSIRLKTQSFPKGQNVVKIAYTYGYSSVPTTIRDLATCLAGIRAWVRFLSGGYNRLSSYSLPQQSVDKGDFYQRGKQNIEMLTDEANRILDRVGKKPRVLFFSTGYDR